MLNDELGSPLGWPGFEGDKWCGDLYIIFNKPDDNARKNIQLAVYFSEKDIRKYLCISYFGPPRNCAEYFLVLAIDPLQFEYPKIGYFIAEPQEVEGLELHQ